jgi:hypothetical protein
MALLEADNAALSGNDKQYWQDELKNSCILLFEYDKAILKLERREEESYTIDTGQTTVTYRFQNLPELIKQSSALIKRIQDITAIIQEVDNTGNNFFQVVPF